MPASFRILPAVRGWSSGGTAPRGIYCARLYAGIQGTVMERNRLDEAQRRPKASLPGFVDHPANAVLVHDAVLHPSDPEARSRRAVMEYAGPQPRKAVFRFPLPVPK